MPKRKNEEFYQQSEPETTNFATEIISNINFMIRMALHAGQQKKHVRTWSYQTDRQDFSRQIGDELMACRFHATAEETGDDIFISIQRVPRGL